MDRKAQEMAAMVEAAFSEVVLTHLFPRTEVAIHVEVLQADGGVRCAVLNAVTLALVDAGVPMRDLLVACDAAPLDRAATLVDLNHVEALSLGGTEVPVAVLAKSSELVYVHAAALVDAADFERVVDRAVRGCRLVCDGIKRQLAECR